MSLSELSAQSRISISYLSRIVRGEVANPTIDFVLRIAEALGVTVSDLVGEPRRRRRGALGPASVESGAPAALPVTAGQRIDMTLAAEDLSREEQARIGEVLVTQAKQLAGLVRSARAKGGAPASHDQP